MTLYENPAEYRYQKHMNEMKQVAVEGAGPGLAMTGIAVGALSLLRKSGAGLYGKGKTPNVKNAVLQKGFMTYQEMLVRTGIGKVLFQKGGVDIAFGAALLFGMGYSAKGISEELDELN